MLLPANKSDRMCQRNQLHVTSRGRQLVRVRKMFRHFESLRRFDRALLPLQQGMKLDIHALFSHGDPWRHD